MAIREGEPRYNPDYYNELYNGASISVNKAVSTFPVSGGEINQLVELGKLEVKVIKDESGVEVDREVRFNKPPHEIGK